MTADGRVWFRPVLGLLVDREQQAKAREHLQMARKELGLPEVQIRWIEQAPPGQEPPRYEVDEWHQGAPTVRGYADGVVWTREGKAVIAIRTDQAGRDLAEAIFHEARHLYQFKQGYVCWCPENERDADAFAARMMASG